MTYLVKVTAQGLTMLVVRVIKRFCCVDGITVKGTSSASKMLIWMTCVAKSRLSGVEPKEASRGEHPALINAATDVARGVHRAINAPEEADAIVIPLGKGDLKKS